jgi:hypothetical protein
MTSGGIKTLENTEVKNLKTATVPEPGDEIEKMSADENMSSGDDYLAHFMDVEIEGTPADAGKSAENDKKVKDRLKKSGL